MTQENKPTIREVLDAAYEHGGDAWDGIDPAAYLRGDTPTTDDELDTMANKFKVGQAVYRLDEGHNMIFGVVRCVDGYGLRVRVNEDWGWEDPEWFKPTQREAVQSFTNGTLEELEELRAMLTEIEDNVMTDDEKARAMAERQLCFPCRELIGSQARDLLVLRKDWDSYGAVPITDKAIKTAIKMLRHVPVLVPTSVGGVQVVYGGTEAFEIGPDGEVDDD